MTMTHKASKQESDPTHQAGNRLKANRDNNRRLNTSAKQVLAMWRNVESKKTTRKKIINQDTTLDFFVYDMTPEELQFMSDFIFTSVNENMETTTEEIPQDWYYKEYIEQAHRGGTIQENSWVTVLLGGLAGFVTVQTATILFSPPYQASLNVSLIRNYPLFKSLSENTGKQVFEEITRGMNAGLSKRTIRKNIIERYEVSKSSAKRIVDTEINKSYNLARTSVIEFYRSIGQPLAVQHLSALLPTTRPHHADRHGRAYTPEQQNQWWDTGTNRINCHCSVRAIQVNRDGTVTNKEAQNKVIARGKNFFKA